MISSLIKRPSDLRVRALFLQNMSGPVLQMLGARYVWALGIYVFALTDAFRFNIEPFYFSSSLNWIPSRFQEEIKEDVGDRKHSLH